MILILGDNLGLNTLLGFSESFSSNYYCRICRCDKKQAAFDIFDNKTLLRNVTNYAIDADNTDFGVKELCFLNQLDTFHVTKNIVCDIMHDIYEGICRYEIAQILYQFIFVNKYFSLDI